MTGGQNSGTPENHCFSVKSLFSGKIHYFRVRTPTLRKGGTAKVQNVFYLTVGVGVLNTIYGYCTTISGITGFISKTAISGFYL